MGTMQHAFLIAAYHYINFTDFKRHLVFHGDEDMMGFAFSHFLSNTEDDTGALSCDPPSENFDLGYYDEY